jgi:hypothetical protein
MTVTMIKRQRDDLTLHLTGLVHARALFEARGATPEDMDTLDHETERIRSKLRLSEHSNRGTDLARGAVAARSRESP